MLVLETLHVQWPTCIYWVDNILFFSRPEEAASVSGGLLLRVRSRTRSNREKYVRRFDDITYNLVVNPFDVTIQDIILVLTTRDGVLFVSTVLFLSSIIVA
jgi:hypothetical protein